MSGRIELLAEILVASHDLLDLVVVGEDLLDVQVALTQWIIGSEQLVWDALHWLWHKSLAV